MVNYGTNTSSHQTFFSIKISAGMHSKVPPGAIHLKINGCLICTDSADSLYGGVVSRGHQKSIRAAEPTVGSVCPTLSHAEIPLGPLGGFCPPHLEKPSPPPYWEHYVAEPDLSTVQCPPRTATGLLRNQPGLPQYRVSWRKDQRRFRSLVAGFSLVF